MFQGLLSSKGRKMASGYWGSGWEGLANHLRSGHGCALQEQPQRPSVMSVSVALSVICSGVKALFQETILSQRSALGLSTRAPE